MSRRQRAPPRQGRRTSFNPHRPPLTCALAGAGRSLALAACDLSALAPEPSQRSKRIVAIGTAVADSDWSSDIGASRLWLL